MTKKEFLSLFLPLKNQWYRYAIWKLKDPLESEEIVQDLYLKLWEIRNKLSHLDSVESYSFMVLKNLCIDRIKRMKVLTVDLDYLPSTPESPAHDALELQDANEMLAEIISQLPENQQLILQLKNVEGHSISDIAVKLGLKKNTVEVNLSRARKKIRSQYKKMLNS
ncbi:MAG: sigma-70 family RNA polymerase sigma factor [Ekhidna sp.]